MPGLNARRSIPALFAALLCLLPAAPRAQSPSFADGMTLIVVDAPDIASLHAARELVQANGGRVAVMVPPSVMLGWVEPAVASRLVGRAGIRDVRWSPVTGAEVGVNDPQAISAIETFNTVVSGEYARRQFEEQAAGGARAPSMQATFNGPDGLHPPDLDEAEVLANLRSAGIDPALLSAGDESPEAPGNVLANSDRMTGVVAVTVFMVESDGSGADPDNWTWTAEAMQTYMDAVIVGMAWWVDRANAHRDCWLTFVINHNSAFDPRCQQWVEPSLHDSGYHEWIFNVMTEFGYVSGSIFSRVNAFNTWQRTVYQANWSFSAFICYNPVGAPSNFADGGTAAAWLYGPYWWSLYRISGWTKDQVISHETGHIFGACDEYAGGCSSCTGSCSIYGTPNANCEACNPDSRGCMMRSNENSLCQYTKGMIGWDALTPCGPTAPAPLPAPTVSSAAPASGLVGLEATFTVTGSNFVAGVEADLGPGVFVHSTTLVNSTTLQVWVSIFNETAPGTVDVVVRNRDGQAATLADGFEILPTRVHYYSASGSNVFPYLSPATAGNTLAAVMAAAADGDTVRVPSMTFTDFSLGFARGVTLQGAWNAGFSARNLATGRTVLQLTGNLDIYPGVTGAGLDGFVIEGGDGRYDVYPSTAYFGGAVRVLTGSVRIANCEIRNSTAGPAGNASYGGAIYGYQSTVDIVNTWIHDNSATRGGALYLDQCAGMISGCTISSNDVASAGVTQADGSGIHLATCNNVTVSNTTVDHHAGGQNGGGLLAENSNNIVIDGGEFAYNTASFSGGAIAFKATQGSVSGTLVRRNSALLGGGMYFTAGSNATVGACRVEWNNATIVGGVMTDNGALHARHNQFVGNAGVNLCGGLSLSGVSTGSVHGNVFDRNTVGAGAGALSLSNTPIEVFNNIVTNTTGAGISANGTLPVLLAYNNVFNASGGLYSGCVPGTGSLSADPLYADTTEADYHLGAHSPCIDAGRTGASYNDPDGSRGDMGRFGSHAFAMDLPARVQDAAVEGAGGAGGTLRLRWSASPEANVVKYAVYASPAAGFTPAFSNFVGFVTAPDTTLSLGSVPAAATTYYRVNAIDADGHAGGYAAEATLTPATPVDPRVVHRNRLDQNVPNPFNPATEIRFELASPGEVALRVYDVSGRLVRTLATGAHPAGEHVVRWDGRDDGGAPVSTGVYFYRLETAGFSQTRKTTLLK